MVPHAAQSASPSPIVSSDSYQQAGVEAERDALTAYLRDTAATGVIQHAMDLAVRAMAIEPGNRVIDVGCGPGDFIPRLAEAVGPSGSIAALDHAPEFLGEARSLAQSLDITTLIDFIEGDALALPFPDASFDAAHTERVLIHVSDPGLALIELRRVVKPGGWVVCVEPDLAGMRIDHERPRLARLLIDSFIETIRFPAMGLELNRRMAEAELIDRTVETQTEVEREFSEGAVAVFRNGAERLIAEQRMDPSDAESLLESLIEQSAAGRYTSYTSMFIVAGRVPPASTS